MKFTLAAVTSALLATSAYSAPVENSVSKMAAVPQWTMVNLYRHCGVKGLQCTWSFTINRNDGSTPTPCSFVVYGNPANQTDSSNNQCGEYTIGTGWSGQFGPGNGFTTLSVVDNPLRQIIWPAYTDKQLVNGVIVKPNQSYAPSNI